MTSRPYDEASGDFRLLQDLAVESWRLDPLSVELTVGELTWAARQHVGRESEWRRRLWFEGDQLVAWGWIQLPRDLGFQVHPHRPELVEEVFDWFEEEAEAGRREVRVRQGDVAAVEGLRRRGYVHDRTAPWIILNARGLDTVAAPRVPEGYRLRTVAGREDVPARVAVHRAAFAPSKVTEESYANVMQTPPYRAELDCVAEAPDGSFAAYALGWIDEVNAVGELEPVGCHPEHRRRGLARAVSLFALEQLRDAGATRALVGCRGDEAYPAPKALYESIGFRPLSPWLPFVRAA